MADILGFDVSEWLDMMSDTITINAWASQSVSGVPSYSPTSTSYPAYIEMENHVIVDGKGREILARGRIFVGSADVIGVKDKITLPSEYTPSSPPILAVDLQNDELGTHHVVIHIG